MNQTIPPLAIIANLPYVFKRDNSTFSDLPDFIKDNPNIYVNWCEDIGPSTKIVPTAKLLFDYPDMYMISVDDDTIYLPSFAETFINKTHIFKDVVLTGASFIHDERGPTGIDNAYYAQLVEGFSGVLYKVKFLTDFDTNVLESSRSCYLGDDLTISNFLRSKSIPIVSLETRDLFHQLDYGFQSDALHKQPRIDEASLEDSNHANYRNCIKWLKDNNNFHFDANHFPDFLKS